MMAVNALHKGIKKRRRSLSKATARSTPLLLDGNIRRKKMLSFPTEPTNIGSNDAEAGSSQNDTDLKPSESGEGAYDAHAVTSNSALMNNALVYSCADRLGIADLKDLAIAKSSLRISEDYHKSDFCDAVRTVFESTPCSDNGLRDIVIGFCADRLEDALSNRDLVTVMSEISPLSWGILVDFKGKSDARLAKEKSLNKQIIEDASRVSADLVQSKMVEAQLERDVERAKNTLDSVVDLIDETDECRHCD